MNQYQKVIVDTEGFSHFNWVESFNTNNTRVNLVYPAQRMYISQNTLIKKAQQTESDLIVLNRNKKGFNSFLRKISRSLPCDVLILKD